MALTASSFEFVYPEYTSLLQTDKVGGYPTDIPLSAPNVSGEQQLFNLAVLYGSSYVQYQKVFIKNKGDEDALNVSVYGYNNNSNSVMKMALEVGQDQQVVYDGQEIIKNNAQEPHLYNYYTFQEILSGAPLSISNVPVGESVGIWLKLEFTSIDAFNEADEFTLGINYEGIAGTPFNVEQVIGHSRIGSSVNIIRIQSSTSVFRGLDIDFEWIDTSSVGIDSAEAVYAVYVDRIFIKEHSGTSRVTIQGYKKSVPTVIEIYLLPYSTYRPDLDALPTVNKNRLQIEWEGRNPEAFDVEKHIMFWDNATGAFIEIPILFVNAEDGYGGGDNIQKVELLS